MACLGHRESVWRCNCCVDNPSPAHKRGDDDAPGSAAAVCTWLLRVRMGVRGIITLAPSAAKPEGVEEEKEEVQAQTEQRNSAEEQDGLVRI